MNLRTAQEIADNEEILSLVRAGDRVTIETPQGQEISGKAVMRGPAGWVLDLGGKHGRPGVATARNLMSVRIAKTRFA